MNSQTLIEKCHIELSNYVGGVVDLVYKDRYHAQCQEKGKLYRMSGRDYYIFVAIPSGPYIKIPVEVIKVQNIYDVAKLPTPQSEHEAEYSSKCDDALIEWCLLNVDLLNTEFGVANMDQILGCGFRAIGGKAKNSHEGMIFNEYTKTWVWF